MKCQSIALVVVGQRRLGPLLGRERRQKLVGRLGHRLAGPGELEVRPDAVADRAMTSTSEAASKRRMAGTPRRNWRAGIWREYSQWESRKKDCDRAEFGSMPMPVRVPVVVLLVDVDVQLRPLAEQLVPGGV